MSIRLEGVTKRIGSALVVNRVSLEVGERELFVLLGRSGSGKSTILRMIAGLTLPDHGRILLHGRDVTTEVPQRRGTGFVFQNYSVFRHMTVAENVEFGLRIRGVRARERRARSEELLALVGLVGLGGRYPEQLSGGQQQRVALARALAYRPSVLLLDEPFGALDVKTRGQLRRALREIQARVGVPTILVTHDQEEAFELADRIGVLDSGRLVEVDAPERLYGAPRTSYSAVFVGAGNVLVGRSLAGSVAIGAIAMPIPEGAAHEEGAPVQVLVRPEHVALTREPPLAGAATLGPGTLVEQRFAGATRRVRVAVTRPAGVRQLAPVPPFGEERLLLDAVLAADVDAPADGWFVSLRGWHVLQPARPRVLVVRVEGSAAPSIEWALRIARRMRAAVSVVALATDAATGARLREGLHQECRAAGEPELAVVLRVGDPVAQVALEQHETPYDLIVVAPEVRRASPSTERSAGHALGAGRNHPGSACEAVLSAQRAPVMFLPAEPPRLERILICTALGQPGETSVRVGGWLARRLGARATLLHVLRQGHELEPLVRAHAERASATLRSMDVECDVRCRTAFSSARGIIDEAAAGDHQLIVVGRHLPPGRGTLVRHDVARQVLLVSDRPVAVIPTIETS
jgi:sulfate transport system ATP-binding protein